VLVEYIPILLGGELRRLLILPISGKKKLASGIFGGTPGANECGLGSYPLKRAMSINLWISHTTHILKQRMYLGNNRDSRRGHRQSIQPFPFPNYPTNCPLHPTLLLPQYRPFASRHPFYASYFYLQPTAPLALQTLWYLPRHPWRSSSLMMARRMA
jgi:hypothetical protein